MYIWLTGSNGFLGTRLGRRLTGAGHRVLGLSRRPDPSLEENVVVDLSARGVGKVLTSIAEKRGNPEAVIHAAGRTNGSYRFREFIRSNLLTTENMMDYIDKIDSVLFIYISTLFLYGQAEVLPVKEDDPVHPAHPYTMSKYWAEQLVEGSVGGNASVVLRLPSLFGAGQKDSFIDSLAGSALVDEPLELFAKGEIIRDVLHVDDAVEGVVKCLEKSPRDKFTRLNLGCGRPIKVLEWAEALVKALTSSSRIIPVDRPSPQQSDLYADIRRAAELIGFTPTPLEETMRRYAQELQAQF